jgi:outer membrane biosynthesis protein TonB
MVSADNDGMSEFPTETSASGLPESLDVASVALVIPIHWDEAVAVVQEVIERLSVSDELPIPSLDAVLIHESGAVTLRPTKRGERGPVAAGRMLHSLLASDVPVALRLFVSQATAPETYASLREFAAGLAYYGKPGRADLIRAVYERYAAANRSGAHHPPLPSVKPPAAENTRVVESARKKSSIGSRLRMPTWLAPAVLTVVALAAAVWMLSKTSFSSTGDTNASTSQGLAEKSVPEDRTKEAVASGGSSASRADGAGSPASQSKATSILPNAALQSPVTSDVPVERIPLPAVPLDLRAGETAPSSSLIASLVADTGTARSEADTIYSGDDADVRPPTMRYPQLPPPLMISSSRPELVNRMEILVAADGSVERVRLVGSPARMTDMMLLSGAKLWKFTPAIKDGEPVRYRAFVTWSGFP